MSKPAIGRWRRRLKIGCQLCVFLWLLPILLFPVRRQLWNWRAGFMDEWGTSALVASPPELGSSVGLLVRPDEAGQRTSAWITDRQTIRRFQDLAFQGAPWADPDGDISFWEAPFTEIYAVNALGEAEHVVRYVSEEPWRPRSAVELLAGLPVVWMPLLGPPRHFVQVEGEKRFFPATRRFSDWIARADTAGSAVTVRSMPAPSRVSPGDVRRAARAAGISPAAVLRVRDPGQPNGTFLVAFSLPVADAEVQRILKTAASHLLSGDRPAGPGSLGVGVGEGSAAGDGDR